MKTARAIILDILALLGVAAATYGVYMIHHPAAWVFGGLAAVAVCWSISRASHEDEGIDKP